jgi:hypothetical protein
MARGKACPFETAALGSPGIRIGPQAPPVLVRVVSSRPLGLGLRAELEAAAIRNPLRERSNRMVKIVIGVTGARSPRRGEAPASRAAVLAAIAWLLVGMMTDSARAEALRWKFKAGEVLHFSIEQKIAVNAKGMDQERKSSRLQTLDISWTVNSVGAGGEAEITLRYDRVRMRNEMPPLMPFEFDSQDSKASVQPGFEAETQQLKAIVGAEVGFKIRPTGEIEDVKLPEATVKRLRDAAPKGTDEGEVSEKSLKEMLLQSSPPSFPDGEIEPGKTWSSKPARMPLGFATMVVEKTFTYQGPDPKAPKLLLVGMEVKATLEPVEGASVTATIRKQEGRGSMSFDAASGHMANARFAQKIDMAITVMGQTMEQITDTTTSMTLVP